MKFRNRFFKYGCTQNNDILTAGANYQPNVYCFADDGGEEPLTMTQAELDEKITAGINAAEDKRLAAEEEDKKNKKTDAFNKIEEERKLKEDEQTKLKSTRKTVAFDMQFNGFIEKNAKAFTISVEKFRESAKGLEGEDLERVLSATAAKDFFRKQENVNLLPERDRDYIKEQILPLAENAIDYRKAWLLIEDALHVKNRIAENGSFRKNTADSNIDNTDTPNVSAYLKKCADAGKPRTSAA